MYGSNIQIHIEKGEKISFFHLKLLKLDRVFVTGQELLGLRLMLGWGSQIVQLGPHNKRKGNVGLRGRKKNSIFLNDRRWSKNLWCERPTWRAAGLLHPRGTDEQTIMELLMQNRTSVNKAEMKHAVIRSTPAANTQHLIFAARVGRCWELKIWNHSCLFAQKSATQAQKKKNVIIKWKNPDAAFPSLSCYQRWFMWEQWFIFSFKAPF